jgi:hypothetical protein
MKIKYYILILIITISSFVQKIKGQTLNVTGVFPTIDHSGRLCDKVDYSLYYFGAFPMWNLKNKSINSDSYSHLFYSEQALTIHLNDKFSFTGSYVYQRSNVFKNNFENENRFYLQGKHKTKFEKFCFTQRLRFDGRYIENNITKKTRFTHRVRYLIGIELQLSPANYFIAYEEIFINTHLTKPKFAENWFYCAFGKKINDKNKIELGMLYVTWNIMEKSWFNQYYFQLTWINQIDLRKKQK